MAQADFKSLEALEREGVIGSDEMVLESPRQYEDRGIKDK